MIYLTIIKAGNKTYVCGPGPDTSTWQSSCGVTFIHHNLQKYKPDAQCVYHQLYVIHAWH
jgi:hypothetical protein